jgi:activator of HSP90 ATPase
MKTGTIRQKVRFKPTPHQVYEALMDSENHSEFTRSQAEISREVGGRFSAYDGWIEGRNLVLEPDKKIVQSWRGKDWPDGHYSTATFELIEVETGTELTFTQTDVPEEHLVEIDKGWVEHYWTPMKKMLEY